MKCRPSRALAFHLTDDLILAVAELFGHGSSPSNKFHPSVKTVQE